MGSFQDQMPGVVEHGLFGLGGAAPQNEYDRTVLIVQRADGCVGEFFPSDSAVGIRVMGTGGQYGIQ